MIQQTPSNKHESCFPDTYKQILEARPRVRVHGHEEPCANFSLCLVCSPMIIPMWVFCCLGVSAKKTKNVCFNCSISTDIKNNVENTTTIIDKQPTKINTVTDK